MSDQGFYLPCPSNASMDIFKENTLSSFTVNLPQPLVLKNEYDVGLAEIQYPHVPRGGFTLFVVVVVVYVVEKYGPAQSPNLHIITPPSDSQWFGRSYNISIGFDSKSCS